MKVLLLHPEDTFPLPGPGIGWDLVVDLGRAPASTYERWSRDAGCRVVSLYDYAEEIKDLRVAGDLLRLGMDRIVDGHGIDWWDVLSLMISPDLQQIILIRRLAKDLPDDCEVYASRHGSLAAAFQALLNRKVINLEGGFQSAARRVRRYRDSFSQLDSSQVAQIVQDKFDSEHRIRRRLVRRDKSSGQAVILLPSAYVNVSRTEVAYAALLPEASFLLVCARGNGKLQSLPGNVRMALLDGYFTSADQNEAKGLLEEWNELKGQMAHMAQEYQIADVAGVLDRIPALLRWGMATRDAWRQVLEVENVVGCLCADDSNPYTRIPLILANKRGVATLACHHGALDNRMAMKRQHADFYLAKSEMERDYLLRVCQVASEKVVVGGPPVSRLDRGALLDDRPWLVFFTEPYQTAGWRTDEVYRDLLPRLRSLASVCGLKLVFKLHPFESVKGHRKWLRRYLPAENQHIEVISGPASSELWQKARFAMTVQSSVALECTALGIPVFLCSWLRDPYTGYVQQYARFGAGLVLESPGQIADIPRLFETYTDNARQYDLGKSMPSERLRELLSGTHVLRPAVGA
jgi:hypothetical protein